ncbi:EF hand domain [Trypanosoma vivax]|uniref:EF-hand domain-containing protein n=1 Tax=Trypanosoma vivax (strain Y486) TaxID=1055687 RepID=G0U0M3_TRYVY|nr:hypothetical protein TRVL_06415 [Trypanosoma vivax]KAH8611011.1 EF hand domain [Trypanosoma vivax]CCC49622.1 conserved hypothetical protein [Trypanosoma vivax Y486]
MRQFSTIFADSRAFTQQALLVDPLPEDELTVYVQRSLLPADVVQEAWTAFHRYRSIEERREKRRQMRMNSIMLKTSGSQQPKSLMAEETGRELTVGRGGFISQNQSRTGSRVGCTRARSRVCLPGDPSETQAGNNCEGENGTYVPKNTVGGEVKEEGEEESQQEHLLKAGGLRQFFEDIDMPISSLEVAELMDMLNDDPADIFLLRKSVESLAEGGGVDAGGTTGGGPKTSTAKKKSLFNSGGRKKSQVDSSARALKAEIRLQDKTLDGKELASLRLHKDPPRDGITFSSFLYILSDLRLEQENTLEAREKEVDDLFYRLDVDGDGEITVNDLQCILKKRFPAGDILCGDRDVKQLLGMEMPQLELTLLQCDVDNDGKVTLSDLHSALQP